MLPQGDPSLDVTLHLGAGERLWCIGQSRRRPGYWNYEWRSGTGVAFGELALIDALTKRREFDAEIAASRLEGWA